MTTPGQQKKPRKERAQLSCTFCRHRKLKCDRNQPCQNCIKRGQQSSCHFASLKDGRVEKSHATDTSAVQKRVQHLEDLVVGMMSRQDRDGLATIRAHESAPEYRQAVAGANAYIPPKPNQYHLGEENVLATEEAPVQAFGKMNVSGSYMPYVGNEHWTAILDDIAEVKKHIAAEEDTPESSSTQPETLGDASDGPDILLGVGDTYTRAELLKMLPPKQAVDRLVSRYFTSADPTIVIVHFPTFEADYERFWPNPNAAPLAWLGLIFGILAQASFFDLLSAHPSSDQIEPLREDNDRYRQIAAQCLIASNYTKPVQWTLEAMMLYLVAEYSRSTETKVGLWVLLGIMTRLCMILGYHRDSEHFPQVSVFQGEIRRRLWAVIVQLDLLSSVSFGLPRMIRGDQTDTRLPGNYLDSELYPDMTELPPPRPDSEYTPMSSHIFKGRLTRVVGRINDAVSATHTPSYEHILPLDEELTAVFEAMPPTLRTKSLVNSITDGAGLIAKRVNLALLYHKGICVLHRRFVPLAKKSKLYVQSRKRSMASAKAMLQHQVVLFDETKLGGRIHSDRWLVSGLTTEDFTLAAMILCLNLDAFWDLESPFASYESEFHDKMEVLELIRRSYEIWSIWKSQPGLASFKATKACQVLGVMLRKIETIMANEEEPHQSEGVPSVSTTEESNAMLTASPFVVSDMATSASYTFTSPDSGFDMLAAPELAPITGWIDAPQDINWDEWDDMFQPADDTIQPLDNIWNFDSGL